MKVLFQSMKEGLLVFDQDGNITVSNPAACLILGLSGEQLKGQLREDILFFSDDGKPIDRQNLPFEKARLQADEVHDQVLRLQRTDGAQLWLKMTATPLTPPNETEGKMVLTTFSDISDVKKSHRIILDQQSRLEANAKLTALGEMAAGVAHEINNPLAIILGKVYMIQKSWQIPEKNEMVETSLEKISDAVDRIKRIVKGLQTFSHGGEQEPFQIANLTQLVNETVLICESKFHEKNIQIQLDLEPNLNFECRPVQISQALLQLIYNSCDAIETQSDRWIRIWARSAHQSLVLTITDSGTGIPEEIRTRLMQPFFTTKDPGQGTGLGLSVTRGLVHSHLGRIWLDPKAAHTTFIIELPLHQKSQNKAS